MGSSSSKDRQLSCQGEPRPPVSHHDHHVPQASDPNHLTQLDGEFQNKLDLKDGDETEDKGSNFEFGGEQLCDEPAAPEPGKSQGVGDDDHDHEHDDEDDGWNVGDEGCNWIEYVNDGVSGDVDEVDVGEVENKDERSSGRAHQYKLRPEAEDCSFYLKTGTCKFGFNCRFNHPVRRKNQAVKEKVGRRDELEERSGQTESKAVKEKVGRRDELEERSGQPKCKAVKEKVGRRDELEERSGQTKCKAVKEKVGRRDELEERSGQTKCKAVKEKVGRRDELEERSGQTECKAVKEKVGQRDELEERSGQTKCMAVKEKVGRRDELEERSGQPKCKAVKEKVGRRDELEERSGQPKCKAVKEKVGRRDELEERSGQPKCKAVKEKVERRDELEERSGQPKCKAVKAEKVGRRDELEERSGQTECKAVKEKVGRRDELEERSGQTECKYYSRSGGCKFGKACKFNHTRGKHSAAPVLELNFLGLPVRLGKKECPYYMRTGSCKFGENCKYNHPDPTTVGGCDPASGYGNGSSISLQGVPQSSIPSWSSTRTLNETAPFVPIILSPTPEVSPRSSDWNGYQAPVYLSESSMHPPSTYAENNPAIETNSYMHHRKPMPVEEFPERPSEPECSYLKTGDCKFKSNHKFRHRKNRITRLPPCNLSDKGLLLRPDQNVCTQYNRFGICIFGPACRFDHPIDPPPSTMPGLDQQSSYTNSASVEMAGNGGASDATSQ